MVEYNSVHYSYSSQSVVKFSQTLKYQKLVSPVRKRMSVNKHLVNLKVIGIYPCSLTPQSVACYAEFNIGDDKLCQIF